MPGHLSKLAAHIENRNDETLFISMRYFFPLVEEPNELYLKYIGLDLETYLKECEKTNPYPIIGKIGRATAAGHNGTWQILHHKDAPHRWKDSSEMGEDKDFLTRMTATEKWKEFDDGEYVLCHNTHSNGRKTIWDI
jgi:hypothetical protein